MFPITLVLPIKEESFPRIRGDVPNHKERLPGSPQFSPHTRGCSGLTLSTISSNRVFPAYAGMFRSPCWPCAYLRSFPRIRGDVPLMLVLETVDEVFSPHTRGCSGFLLRLHIVYNRFPRIRGDVPQNWNFYPSTRAFSPHTRGCSLAI